MAPKAAQERVRELEAQLAKAQQLLADAGSGAEVAELRAKLATTTAAKEKFVEDAKRYVVSAGAARCGQQANRGGGSEWPRTNTARCARR